MMQISRLKFLWTITLAPVAWLLGWRREAKADNYKNYVAYKAEIPSVTFHQPVEEVINV